MARQRDQQDFRWQPLQIPYGSEAVPGLALGGVTLPAGNCVPLERPVAAMADETFPMAGCTVLGVGQMNRRLGEILQTAGVIEVEVSQDDVSDIPGGEAQLFNLAGCCLAGVELDS